MASVQQTSNKATRRLSQLERRLKQQLQAFYEKHIKGSNAPIQTIRQRYGEDIEQLIRNNVQTSWLYASDIMAEKTGQEINISVPDIEGINKVTAEMTNQFWTTSDKNLQREHEFEVNPTTNKLEEMPEYALPAAMVSISALMIYLAFNQSMTSKAAELGGIKLKFITRNDCIDTKICLPLNGQIFDVGQVLYNPPLHRHCHCKLIPVSA